MILGIVLALLSVLHYYIIRDRKYFERINVKFVNPFPLLGTSWKAIFGYETYFDYYERIYKQFPTEKFFGAFDFLKPVYVIRDVELCRKVMITNFDHFVNRRLTIDVNTDPVAGRFIGFVKNESWRKLRAITSPAFTGNKMKFIVSLLNESMQKITKNLGVKIKLSEKKCFRYNGYDFYTRCCTNLIANTTFGLEVNAVDEENDEFYLMGKRLTDLRKDFFLRAILFQVSPTLAKVLNISLFDREATEYLKRIAKETIDYRTKNNVKVPNFIQLFMDADLSFEEIIPECIAFFFGGIDSFSTLFQFISYELALNPDVQKRLQSEIDQIQSQLGGSSIEYESVQKLTYMDAVINETFRKNPAGAFLERVCNKPFKIREKSETEDEIILKSGDCVIVPMSALPSDPQHFPNPEKFDPNRFLNKTVGENNLDAFIPFGIGPRQCIANRFAMIQTKVFFFNLLSKFTIKANDETKKEIKLLKGSLLRKVEGEISFDLVLREKLE